MRKKVEKLVNHYLKIDSEITKTIDFIEKESKGDEKINRLLWDRLIPKKFDEMGDYFKKIGLLADILSKNKTIDKNKIRETIEGGVGKVYIKGELKIIILLPPRISLADIYYKKDLSKKILEFVKNSIQKVGFTIITKKERQEIKKRNYYLNLFLNLTPGSAIPDEDLYQWKILPRKYLARISGEMPKMTKQEQENAIQKMEKYLFKTSLPKRIKEKIKLRILFCITMFYYKDPVCCRKMHKKYSRLKKILLKNGFRIPYKKGEWNFFLDRDDLSEWIEFNFGLSWFFTLSQPNKFIIHEAKKLGIEYVSQKQLKEIRRIEKHFDCRLL